jgi:hypothetical protein
MADESHLNPAPKKHVHKFYIDASFLHARKKIKARIRIACKILILALSFLNGFFSLKIMNTINILLLTTFWGCFTSISNDFRFEYCLIYYTEQKNNYLHAFHYHTLSQLYEFLTGTQYLVVFHQLVILFRFDFATGLVHLNHRFSYLGSLGSFGSFFIWLGSFT